MEFDSHTETPNDWWALEAVVRRPNPRAVIAFSAGDNERACIRPGLDNFTAETLRQRNSRALAKRGYPE